jgi:hypothetical protein
MNGRSLAYSYGTSSGAEHISGSIEAKKKNYEGRAADMMKRGLLGSYVPLWSGSTTG